MAISFNRNRVRAHYRVVHNIIQNDEFRGAPVFGPHYFYKSTDAELGGERSVEHTRILSVMDESQTSPYVALTAINAEERSEFPELGDATHVMIVQNPDAEQVMFRLVFADEVDRVLATFDFHDADIKF